MRIGAAELVGWARLAARDVAGAHAATAGLPGGAAPSVSFQAAYALAAGQPAQGISLLAWTLVNRPDEPTLPFALTAASSPAVAADLTHELLLQGPAGRHAATRLAAWYASAGHQQAAATVSAMLAGYAPTSP